MLAVERQHKIEQLVQGQGSVTLTQLTAMFGVSSETIRKDLLLLEKAGVLTRTHGGAIRKHGAKALAPLAERKQSYIREKQELCGYALQLIRDGDIIAIDQGSTGLELAKLVAASFTNLTVATHSLEVIGILAQNPKLELILCGGNYVPEELCFAGPLTVKAIEDLHFHKCFLCPSGVSLTYGITEFLPAMVEVQRAYIRRADQTCILAYSQRFEKGAKIKLDDVRPDFTYVTDSGLPDEIAQSFLDRQIMIIKE